MWVKEPLNGCKLVSTNSRSELLKVLVHYLKMKACFFFYFTVIFLFKSVFIT